MSPPAAIVGFCTMCCVMPGIFNGFVVSDAVAVKSLITHGFARDPQDAAYKVFTAGLNMDMASGTCLKYLPINVQQKRITVALAQKSDIAILVLGEIDLMSGEAASRSSLRLSNGQEDLLEAVSATGKPVILVLINGRPLEIAWAAEHVSAILEAWYPGNEGGNAIADLLFGDATPSGHLPVSWPRTTGQTPIYYNHNLTQSPETAPDFKSRYWDVVSTPLYPFGYGLSYTTFSVDHLGVMPSAGIIGGTIEVSADVTNTGQRAGDAVVQLYIHQRAGSASRPVRQLKGFQRATLQPGEKQTLHFTLGKNELQFWSPAEEKWVVEPEQFDVWVGQDSTATLHGEFKLTK
jgi:beta-glucosidase